MRIEGAQIVCSPADSGLENMYVVEVTNRHRERFVDFDNLR